jgi:predicted MFS family arabinose efflux permease
VGFAMALQMGLNANYLADDIGVSGFQLGLLEAVRESCGIAALGFLAMLAGLAEPTVGVVVLLLFSLGIGGYGLVHSFGGVVLMSVIWSQGLHIWMPLPHSMGIALAEPGRTGYRLGQMGAAGAVGTGTGLIVAYILTRLGVGIRPLYGLAAGAGVTGALFCARMPRTLKTPGPRLVFRRRYGLYYLLSFLEGWRKQIFICFAGYLLVREYGTPVSTMILLWVTVTAIGYLTSPRVGRLIDRIGERRVLVFYFACLSAFFVSYAFVKIRAVLYAIFVIDSAFFVFATALNTYVGKLAPAAERTPTLSMGVAMNHVAAVIMPLVGGILWSTVGYEWAFVTGACAAVASALICLRLPAREDTSVAAQPPRQASP